MFETEEKLYKWASWANAGGLNIGYKSPMGVLMRDAVGSTVRTLNVTDEEAQIVDAALGQLKQRNRAAYDAIKLKYLKRRGLRDIAKDLRCSRERTAQLLASGVAWIDARISTAEDFHN